MKFIKVLSINIMYFSYDSDDAFHQDFQEAGAVFCSHFNRKTK
jgi:hypothetical protein